MIKEKDYAVVINDLCFSIGEIEILKNIGIKIEKGEFVGLIGPNGAGKTTLLKCINGIYKAKGSVTIDGIELKRMNEREIAKRIAIMHQDTSISFPFTALDVVLMGRYPHLSRMQKESRHDYEIARKNMKYTDTIKLENKPVTQISGGERQRVIYAKVLTQETDIILLDEPTASLDISHQEQIFKYSRELSAAGKTVIAAVHDLKIASRYCTKLVLMKDGQIISQGRPDEVLTSANISQAYGVNALVYKNRITGLLDFYIYEARNNKQGYRVHVVGGGGSASGIIRQLYENGFKVTTGVLAHGDSDLLCAEVFGIPAVTCEPFNDVPDESFKKNIEMIKEADLTILCNMPFGWQNLRNLEAAQYARRLVIIEDDMPKNRDFSGGKALQLYNSLKQKAEITSSARLHEVL